MSAPEALADGLWRWTARHPEWHPRTELGAEVACFAVREGAGTVLVDPLLPDGDEELREALDALVTGTITVAITIPYHVRSASEAARRWDATVTGHRDLQRRLEPGTPFRAAAPGEPAPGGIRVHAIPRRKEQPVELPDAGALAFGDAVVGVGDALRVWIQRPLTEQRRVWFERQLLPTLEPLLAVEFERALVTHGPPVLRDGRGALAAAFAAGPWYHQPS